MKNFNFMDGNLSLKIDEVSNNSMSISNKLRNQKRKEKGRGHKKRNRKYIRFDT